MSLYGTVLFTHSLLRWAVLLAAALVCARSFLAARRGRAWGRGDERLHVLLVSVLDLQLLLGLALYVALSPFSRAFFDDFRMGMADPVVRFFGVEHGLAMVVAITIVHIGRVRSKRQTAGTARHRVVWISTLIALLLILVSIPWPVFPYARPLLRGLV